MNSKSPIPIGHFVDLAQGGTEPWRVHYHELSGGGAEGMYDVTEAVIFLHGAGAGASGYSNFKGNFPEFAQAGYRTLVPDLLGFGLSSKPDLEAYDLDFFIAGVKGLVDALGLKRVTLVGNSLGGAVAIGYALAYPDEVARLILMAPGGLEALDVYLAMPGIANMFAIYKAGLSGAEAMRSVLRMQLYDPALLTEALIAERVPIAALQTQAARSAMRVPDMSQRLSELPCPVLCFWGVDDQFVPCSGATKLLAHCHSARVIMLNRCGHWVQIEHRDLFNRQCLDFLAHG